MTRVQSSTCRSDSTSRAPWASALGRSGRRASGGSVSAWRNENHSQPISAKSTKPPNTACQPPSQMNPCPIEGASAGTIMNTVMMKLVIRAISRP